VYVNVGRQIRRQVGINIPSKLRGCRSSFEYAAQQFQNPRTRLGGQTLWAQKSV